MVNDGAVSYETKNNSDWVSIYFNEFRTAYNDRESYLMSKKDVYYLNEIKLNKLMFSFMNSSWFRTPHPFIKFIPIIKQKISHLSSSHLNHQISFQLTTSLFQNHIIYFPSSYISISKYKCPDIKFPTKLQDVADSSYAHHHSDFTILSAPQADSWHSRG